MAEGPSRGRTLVDKIWRRHQMTEVEGERLLYVDYLLLHEGARHAFDDLEEMGRERVPAAAGDRLRGPLRADPQPQSGARRGQGSGGARDAGAARPQRPHLWGAVFRLRRSAAGHPACGGAGARHHPAGPPHRRRRFAHHHPRRLRLPGVRHRRLRCAACAGDAGAVARLPQADADRDRRRAQPACLGQGPDPRHHRPDRGRRRHRPCHRVRRQRGAGHVDGAAHDALQHVDRGRRPDRHRGAGRDHVCVSGRPRQRAQRRAVGQGAGLLADAAERR